MPGSRLFPPELAVDSHNGEQRIRRLVTGETTKWSDLDADHLIDGTKPADAVTIVRGGVPREVGGKK